VAVGQEERVGVDGPIASGADLGPGGQGPRAWWKRWGDAVVEALLSTPGQLVATAVFGSLVWVAVLRSLVWGIVTGLSMTLMRADEEYTGEQWQRALRRIELSVPFATFALVGIVGQGVRAPSVFFQVSSQVIVVLILAAALQARVFNLKRRKSPETNFVALMVVMLAWGEYSSLRALILDTRADASITIAAIAAGLAAVLIAAMTGRAADDA